MPRATVHPFPMNQCVVWTDWSTFPLVMQDVDSITSGWTALWVNLRYTSAPFVFISKKSSVHICFESKNNWGFFQAYMDCACIQNSFMYTAMMKNKTREAAETTTISMTSSTVISNQTNATAMPNAFQGICPGDCKLIWVVVPLLFIGMLMTFTTVSPTQTATLRYF